MYDGDLQFLTLTFDRAIDISAMDVSALIVYDGAVMNFIYQGYNEPDLMSPTSVRVALNGIAEDPPPGEHLDAGAGNGIVAEDDGAAWAGCEDWSCRFRERLVVKWLVVSG